MRMQAHLKNRRAPPRLLIGVSLLGVLLGATALATGLGTASSNGAECCLNASSALSNYLNPPLGEDNNFFRQVAGGDATIAFVLMNRKEMRWFPESLFEMRVYNTTS